MPAILDDPPYFRPRELDRILAVLGRKRPAVVVLTGAPGMGKSGVLDALRSRAAAQGWAIGGSYGDHRLVVEPRTTQETFREDVVGTLQEAAEAATTAPHGPASALAASSPLVHRARSVNADPVVAELARRSGGNPVLITIDDFRPSPAFGSWFERRFVPALLASELPIVVAMAERLGGVDVRASATEVIELGPLSPDFVRQALSAISDKLDPPLSDHEFTVYGREARSPVLLDSLLRALALAEARERRP